MKTFPPTTTPGKLEATEWARKISVCRPGISVGLVGDAEGLTRHVQDKRRLFFHEQDIYFVERNEKMFSGLQQCNREKRLLDPTHIVHGDIFHTALDLLEKGEHISHFDFDGTETWNPRLHLNLSLILAHQTIDNVHLIASQRTPTEGGNRYMVEQYKFIMAERGIEVRPEIRPSGGKPKLFDAPCQSVMWPEVLEFCYGDMYHIAGVLSYTGLYTQMLMAVLNKR